MNKPRELASLRRLEMLAMSPAAFASRAQLKGIGIAIGAGVITSLAGVVLGPDHPDAVRWAYFVAGLVAGVAAQFLGAAKNAPLASKYLDSEAIQRRIAELQSTPGADV